MRDPVFDASLAGLYVVDLIDKRHLSINRAYTEITGYELQDLHAIAADRFIELFHEDDRERVLRHFDALASARIGEPLDLTYRFRAADGRWLECVSRHVPSYRAPNGVLRQVVGSLMPAHTRPYSADRSLDRETAAQLDALFSAAPVGLGFWDTGLRFKRLNNKLAEINGLPLEAHIGRRPDEILPNIHGLDELMARWRVILATGEVWSNVEVTGATHASQGERIWREHFFPVAVDGSVIGLGAVVEDVTERRLAQEALRDSERSLRAFIAQSPLMTGIVELASDDSDVLHLIDSTASERFFGVDAGGTSNRWAQRELGVQPDTIRTWATMYRRAQQQRSPVRFSHLLADGGGGRRILDTFVAYIGPGAEGREKFCYFTIDDTDRHRMEETLRTSDRRKSDFLAILGHELRNPLAPLNSGLELLRRSEHDPALTRRLLEMMQRQVGLLVRLVDDLLDVASIGRGQIALSRRVFDLREALHSALEQTAARAESRQQSVRSHEPLDALPIDGDVARLTQVFTNLLGNAIRYTNPGGSITVSLERDQEHAVAKVADTGRGIAADHLDTVFDLFSRVGDHDGSDGHGLGIGLALVRRLVELHGGAVLARSEGPGCGSEFVVRLPLAGAPR